MFYLLEKTQMWICLTNDWLSPEPREAPPPGTICHGQQRSRALSLPCVCVTSLLCV